MEPPLVLILLPFGLVLLIGAWVALGWRRESAQAGPGPNGVTPYGVHGWLRFSIFALYVLSPLVNASSLSRELQRAEKGMPQLLEFEGWASFKSASWLVLLGTIAWDWWVAYNLTNRLEARSVYHAKRLLAAAPFVSLVELVLVKTFLRADASAQMFVPISGAFIGTALVSFMWLLYFTRSRRVRNTYRLNPSLGGYDSKITVADAVEDKSQIARRKPAVQSAPDLKGEATPVDAESHSVTNDPQSVEVRLEALKRMFDRGLISREDFEAKKTQLLRIL